MTRALERARFGTPIAGMLFGLTLSAVASPTMSIAPGFCADSTGLGRITLSAALAKSAAAWSVGSAGGSVDTGSIQANTCYHWYVISNPLTGASDAACSLSPSAPGGLPVAAGFTMSRRIGSAKMQANGQWVGFVQAGDEFLLKTSVTEQNTTVPTTPTLLTLASVPLGVQVGVKLRGIISGPNVPAVLFQSPDEAGANVNSPSGNMDATASANQQAGFNLTVRTNTASQIVWNAILGSTSCSLVVYGWNDSRGKNA